MRRIRPNLTYANVMSTIAVFGVLAGGGAWAASKIGTNQIQNAAVTARKLHKSAATRKKIKNDAVTGAKVENESLTGNDVDESTLSAPIAVDHAKLADHATLADHAKSADNSTNLGGQPASDYRLHCPGNLDRAGDLCYEFDLRPAATPGEAMKACALDQRRLPDDGELALVFDHLGAPQPRQLTAGNFFDQNMAWGSALIENSSRVLILSAVGDTFTAPFRCVTSATN